MKTHSPFQLETYQVMGRKLHINFNEQIVEGDEDMEDQYIYDTAVIPDKLSPRDVIIEAVMKAIYPTYGKELAAIRNNSAEHDYTKSLSKALADGWLNGNQPDLNIVPSYVSSRQAHEALIHSGLYQTALDTIAAIQDPVEKLLTENYFHKANEFERDNGLLITMANSMGLTAKELDDLFRRAVTL